MHLIFMLVMTAAVVSAQHHPPKSHVPEPHLRGHGNIEIQPQLHHGRTLKTGLPPATYTLDADFADGSFVNVNAKVTNQLQLSSDSTPFNFIWVPCSSRGTIVKVDTITGKILSEYKSAPDGIYGNPSRTTVDKDGSVWLTNRDLYPGTVVHIGLDENNQCNDRNSSKIIDTSQGLGDIRGWPGLTAADAKDECIVHYSKVSSAGTRHVSIDANNDVWVSGISPQAFDKIKGGKYDIAGSGTIVKSYASVGYGGYGGLMDKNGVIWSTNPLLRWDTSLDLTGANGDPSGDDVGPPISGTNWTGNFGDTYGSCIDSQGNVWITKLSGSLISKYASTGVFLGSYAHGNTYAQGCVVGKNDDVWVAHSLFSSTTAGHIKNDGSFVGTVDLSGGVGPTGVSVDARGKVWSANYISSTLSRIDPTLSNGVGAVDLTVDLGTGCNPYTYGDMTGSTNKAAPNSGSWTVIHDSGVASTPWGSITWNENKPPGSVLNVNVRLDDSAAWQSVTNGQKLSLIGQKLQVQVLFERGSNGISPVLYDLTINPINQNPDCSKALANPSTIYPANNKFVSVAVKGVTDSDGDNVAIKVKSIYQDEPRYKVNAADATITATGGAQVRAFQKGANKSNNGRVYHIKFTANDGKGGTCDGEVKVCVPYKKYNACVDGGALYDSTKKYA